MYNVVEFDDDGGGGVSVIRREWLTPHKQRCMWPPPRFMTKFNKCIDGSMVADDSWEIFKIKRVFYETDNLAKAREKEKQAEIDSEINSDHNDQSARKRKKTRKIYESDSSPDESDDQTILYPTPPATTIGSDTKTPKTHSAVSKTSSMWCASPGDNYKHARQNQDSVNHTPLSYSTPRKQVPATKIHSTLGTSTDEKYISEKDKKQVPATKIRSTPGTSTDEEYISEKYKKQVPATKIRSTPGTSTDEEYISEKYKKQVPATKIRSTPGTSTDEEYISEKYKKQVATIKKRSTQGSSTGDEGITEKYQVSDNEVSLQSLGSLDLTVTPFLKETPNSQALDVIAKHLARIQTDIRELQISQQEILQRIRSFSSNPMEHSLPDEITLPCDDNEALVIIETWIKANTENKKRLITYLSLVGGSKIPIIIRRILEKLFTNKLAVLCNWTGKNRKIPLKDLQIINIIKDAVRQNQIAANATDAEIHEVISNWFRFTKDRNGGREARRVQQ